MFHLLDIKSHRDQFSILIRRPSRIVTSSEWNEIFPGSSVYSRGFRISRESAGGINDPAVSRLRNPHDETRNERTSERTAGEVGDA